MSNDPKQNLNDADKEKNSSSSNSKPNNVFSLENSEPSSNPLTLPSARISSDAEKKLKTGPKAVLPGAVAESTAARNEKQSSSPTHNTLTEFVSDKEETRGSNYRRRKVAPPRYISEPTIVRNKKGSFTPANNAGKERKTLAATSSLEDSEPCASPASMKSSGADKKMKTVLPGAVADT